mgnify:CR=1 FL=1
MKIPQNTKPELRQAVTSQTQEKVRTMGVVPTVQALQDGEMVIVATDLYVRSGTKLIRIVGTEYNTGV